MRELHSETIIRGPGRRRVYPFETMEVGQTFYEPFDKKTGKCPFARIYNARAYWEKKLPGRKFDVHAVSVGLRVQRVE